MQGPEVHGPVNQRHARRYPWSTPCPPSAAQSSLVSGFPRSTAVRNQASGSGSTPATYPGLPGAYDPRGDQEPELAGKPVVHRWLDAGELGYEGLSVRDASGSEGSGMVMPTMAPGDGQTWVCSSARPGVPEPGWSGCSGTVAPGGAIKS